MMTIRTKDAFYQLEKLVTTPEQKAAFEALKASVTAELAAAEKTAVAQARAFGQSTNRSFVYSVPGQRVLARAMRADPVATELDLLDAGQRDLAAFVGSAHAAEVHRQQGALPGVSLAPG